MTYRFSQPGKALSRQILRAVPYQERFPAGRLKPPVGIVPGDVRSLPELHLFLEPDHATLPGINLKQLPEWIASAIGDEELAASVRTIVDRSGNYVEECLKVYEAVGVRLDQARKAVGEVG